MTENYKKFNIFASVKILFALTLFAVVMHNIVVFYPSLLSSVLHSIQIIYKTVFCVIFPYMVTAQIICTADICSLIPDFFKKIYVKIFGVSYKTVTAFVMGNLCGYPIGAKILCEQYKANQISRKEAEYMLPWCTNSSPAFVIGTIGAVIFANVKAGIILFAVQILSAVICAFFFAPDDSPSTGKIHMQKTKPFAKILSDSCISVLEISGTVLIFNLFVTMIKNSINLFNIPNTISNIIATVLCCVFEITNGVISLGGYTCNPMLFAAVAAANCWSGISVLMQVKMILYGTDIKCGIYIKRKVIQSLAAAFMMYAAAVYFGL